MEKNLRRILGGKKATASGASFESRFKSYVIYTAGGGCLRIENGCKQVSAFKLIRVRQPCDFIVSINNKIIILDTKSTTKGSYSAGREKVMFQLNEMESMLESSPCGYLVEFQDKEMEIFWFPVTRLKNILGDKSNLYLKKELGIHVGSSFPFWIDFGKIIDARS